jgi:hypothetical protein
MNNFKNLLPAIFTSIVFLAFVGAFLQPTVVEAGVFKKHHKTKLFGTKKSQKATISNGHALFGKKSDNNEEVASSKNSSETEGGVNDSSATSNDRPTFIVPKEKAANFEDYLNAARAGQLEVMDPTTKTRSSGFRKKLAAEIGDPPEQGMDADHTVELCVGGADCPRSNGQWLDKKANRAAGSKIGKQIKQYPVGTVFGDAELEQ